MKKILLVDDDPSLRHVIAVFLAGKDIQIIEASTGRHGLDLFRSTPDIALIVSDYNMPEMDGVEMTREIRKESLVPIIIMSGDEIEKEALEAGATFFLPKSAPVNDLKTLVHGHINQP